MLFTRFRALLAILAIATATMFVMVDFADARGGRGGSIGSRGARTYTAPAQTRTAPNVSPMERSMTQPGANLQRGGIQAPARQGGFFNRGGFLGGLAAGFLGAGLLGLLFGGGLLGGLGGLASMLGLLLQVVLVVIVARLAWSWWQRRNQPAPAMAGGPAGAAEPLHREAYGAETGRPTAGRPMGLPAGLGLGGGGLGGGGAAARPQGPSDEIGIGKDDYDAFEQSLADVQSAYAREDLAALRQRVTPEMLSYFNEEFADYASRGVVNEISDVKLLQGDLAEAWREDGVEYATVAMRYELIDRLVDRASGRVVEGGDAPQEVTEIWTFRRALGGSWLLSAIQQG